MVRDESQYIIDRRKRARSDGIDLTRCNRRKRFRAKVVDFYRNVEFSNDGAQKRTFASVAFDAVHFGPGPFCNRHRNDNARKTCAGSEI